MIYDVVIIGAGAAGLYAGICLDKNLKKVILEKTGKPGMKVLMSGGERANISNADIEPMRDYFTQNKKFLLSIFSRYTNWDIMSFFAQNGVNIVEEDRSRLILESGNSQELLDCLLKNLKKNNCELLVNQDVKEVETRPFRERSLQDDGRDVSLKHLKNSEQNLFQITTAEGKKYTAKNVIVSSGGKTFPQIGTTGEAYEFAKKLDLQMVHPYRTLCGLATKRDLSEISGVSTDLQMILYDKNFPKKKIYQEFGPLLFTHFGVTGPIVHNVSNAIGEYLNTALTPTLSQGERENIDQVFEKYILENLYLELTFDVEKTPKRVVKFFDIAIPPLSCPSGDIRGRSGGGTEENNIVKIDLQNWRSWREAKATGGGVCTSNLDNHMQVKKYPGLYFIGEAVDVTGKTGGFNLQWAWSSAFVASENINKNFLKK
ncbi:NAD(P)/FAD-dependent oxidoreductase [Candidatus Gracilibacteria bacterium]|nr:NAD(P)/FAD-dependent oxidoreductase [Candidatus Gracilibacteria bacterium]